MTDTPTPAPESLPRADAGDSAEGTPRAVASAPSAESSFDEQLGALVSDLDAHEIAAREAKDGAEDCRAQIKQLLEESGVLKTRARFGNRAWTVTLKRGAERAEVDDAATIPPQYTTLEPKVDRSAVKKALKSGESIPGARLVRGSSTVAITGELE